MSVNIPYSSRGLGTIRGNRKKTLRSIYELAIERLSLNARPSFEKFTEEFLKYSNLPDDLFTKKMGEYMTWINKPPQERKEFTEKYILPLANENSYMEKITDFVIAIVDGYNNVHDQDVDPATIVSTASIKRFGKTVPMKVSDISRAKIHETNVRRVESTRIKREQRQLRLNSGYVEIPLHFLQSGGDSHLKSKIQTDIQYLINAFGVDNIYAAWRDKITISADSSIETSRRYKNIKTTPAKAIDTIIHFLRAMFQRYSSRLSFVAFYFYKSEQFRNLHMKYPNLFVSIDKSNCVIDPINKYIENKIKTSKTEKKKNLYKKIQQNLNNFVKENEIIEKGFNIENHTESISNIIKSSLLFKDVFGNIIFQVNKPKSRTFNFTCTANNNINAHANEDNETTESEWTFCEIQETVYYSDDTRDEVKKYITPTSIIQIIGDGYKVYDNGRCTAIKHQILKNIKHDDSIFSVSQIPLKNFLKKNKQFLYNRRDAEEQQLFKLADSHRLNIDYNCDTNEACFIDQNSAYPTAIMTIEGTLHHPHITPYGFPNYPTHYYYFLQEVDTIPQILTKMTGFFLVRFITLDQILVRQLKPYFFKQINSYCQDDIYAVLPSSLFSYIQSKHSPNNKMKIAAVFWNNRTATQDGFSIAESFLDTSDPQNKIINNSLIGSLIFNEDKMKRSILISKDSYEYFRDVLMSNNRFLGPHEKSQFIEYRPTEQELQSAKNKKNYHIHSFILAAQNILLCDILYKVEEEGILNNVTKTKLDAIYFNKQLDKSFLSKLPIGKGPGNLKYVKLLNYQQSNKKLNFIDINTEDDPIDLPILNKINRWSDSSTNIYYMDKGINVYHNNECAGSGKSHRSFNLSKYSAIFMTQTNNLVQDAKSKVNSITTYKAFDISPFVETKVSMKLPNEHIHIFDEVGLLKIDIARETILLSIKAGKLVYLSYDEYQTNFDEEIYQFLSSIKESIDVQTSEQYRMSKDLQILSEELKLMNKTDAIKKLISTDIKRMKLDEIGSSNYNPSTDIILCGTNKMRCQINSLLEVGSDSREIKTRDLVSRSNKDISLARGKMRIFSNEEKNKIDKLISKKNIEITHAFTVHSVQGQTIGGQVFIYPFDMWSMNIIYTAITRAKSVENIVILY